MTDETDSQCDGRGSNFIAVRSAMAGLCVECACQLDGYEPCGHDFENGRCSYCGGTDRRRSFFVARSCLL